MRKKKLMPRDKKSSRRKVPAAVIMHNARKERREGGRGLSP